MVYVVMTMRRFLTRRGALAALAALPFLAGAGAASAPAAAAPVTQTAVFAGGCFWGMELVFESLKGVDSAVSGYAGGSKDAARYETVSTGTTGHAESVRVTFEPARISYEQLLTVYFTVAHDPTQRNRQGPDDGTQYRSVVFYTSAAQRRAALAEIRALTAARTFSAPIVTEVVPLRGFFAAESYHQHYAARNPNDPYIAFNDAPKLAQLKSRFPALVRPGNS